MSAVPRPEGHAAAAIEAAEAETLFAPLATCHRLLIAVSGGPDSVALLALLAEWAKTDGRPTLHAATVDHRLRPESAEEAAAVGALCARLGVPHSILIWDGAKPSSGLQAAARQARYALLTGEAGRLGGAAIVTAHTLDDQAETLLMRLAHGSGPSGLAGMRPRSRRGNGEIIRPLLSVPKARLMATLEARELPFVTDPSNANPRFERVRWRNLAPLLAEQGLDAMRLGQLARRLARQDEALAQIAAEALDRVRKPRPVEGVSRLDLAAIGTEPEEVMLRVLARALAESGDAAEQPLRLERIEACVEALRAALGAGLAMRRTLSGFILSLDAKGVLTIRPEGPRRRGVHPATSSLCDGGAFTSVSLGKGSRDT